MNETIVISVSRKTRPAEVFLRRLMAALAILFLAQGILLSTGFMLPCFLTALCYYWYRHASRREYEYTLEEGRMKIERVSSFGRRELYEIPFDRIELLCDPDAPEAAPYRKGGSVKVVKEDYTSYRDGVPYYTMIVRDSPRKLKLLLDLTPEAVRMIRRQRPGAVKVRGIA